MNNHHFTSSRQSSVDPTVISNRNELLLGAYAAIDTEYKFNQSHGSKAKPYTIFSVAIVDSLGNVKVKHESDFWNHQFPEKALVQWALSGILQYRLTIGWYTKGVRIQNEDGTFTGTDSDLKIIDDACRYYKIPSVIGFDKRGIPYVRGYHYSLCDTDSYYARLNKFDRYYHIDLYQVYKKPMVKTSIYQSRYKDLSLGSV